VVDATGARLPRLSLGQCAHAKFSPTATRYESWIGDCTAITRQFAQSSPSIEGSIWSRRGNLPPRDISIQSRRTRSTSRRFKLNKTITVSESMFDIHLFRGTLQPQQEVSRLPVSVHRVLPSWLYRPPLPNGPRGRQVPAFRGPWDASRNFASDWPYLPLTSIWPVEPSPTPHGVEGVHHLTCPICYINQSADTIEDDHRGG